MIQTYELPAVNTKTLIAFFHQTTSEDVSIRLKCFYDLFPYAEYLPGSLALMDHQSKILACNDYAWKQVKLENISQLINHTSDEVEKMLGWREDLIGRARENDRQVLELGQSVHHESILVNEYETILVCKKEAIYADDGKPLGLISLAMPVERKNRSIVINYDSQKISLILNNNQSICLSFREYTILRQILHGLSGAQIATKLSVSPKTVETYVMRIKLKFNCQKQREIIPILIRNNLAASILDQSILSRVV